VCSRIALPKTSDGLVGANAVIPSLTLMFGLFWNLSGRNAGGTLQQTFETQEIGWL